MQACTLHQMLLQHDTVSCHSLVQDTRYCGPQPALRLLVVTAVPPWQHRPVPVSQPLQVAAVTTHFLLTSTNCLRFAISVLRGASSSSVCTVSPFSRADLYQCTVMSDIQRQLGLQAGPPGTPAPNKQQM